VPVRDCWLLDRGESRFLSLGELSCTLLDAILGESCRRQGIIAELCLWRHLAGASIDAFDTTMASVVATRFGTWVGVATCTSFDARIMWLTTSSVRAARITKRWFGLNMVVVRLS
jgi:hypothetical protein